MPFDFRKQDILYLKRLDRSLIANAHEANFIDEPIWNRADTLKLLDLLTSEKFAASHIFVYGLLADGPAISARAVYDHELPLIGPDVSWVEVVETSNSLATDFVSQFAFNESDGFSKFPAGFTIWAYDESNYRKFTE